MKNKVHNQKSFSGLLYLYIIGTQILFQKMLFLFEQPGCLLYCVFSVSEQTDLIDEWIRVT